MLDQFNDTLIEGSHRDDVFEVLYTDYFSPIYRYVFYRLRDKDLSMDIVQNVFLNVFNHKDTIRLDKALPYLYTVARNQIIDYLRKKHSIAIDDFDNFIERIADDSIPLPEQSAQTSEQVTWVRKALAMLPETQKEAVILHYLQDLDYSEMTSITGKSESALRQSVSRGVRTLQDYYADYE